MNKFEKFNRAVEESKMVIMQRRANNDFEAMLTAQGMENAGADVFSISYVDHRYIVWAKVDSNEMINAVDEAIESALE